MPRGIDKVQLIGFPIFRLVIQSYTLGFDRDTALPLQVHRIEDLSRHFTVRQTTTGLDKAVGQGRFTVVDMGNDGKISNVIEVAHVLATITILNRWKGGKFTVFTALRPCFFKNLKGGSAPPSVLPELPTVEASVE